jgi:hypothetical protein
MRRQKIHVVSVILSVLVLFTFLPGFQGVKVEHVSLSGSVDKIDHEQKAVSLNGERILLSSGTPIVDEEGNRLSFYDIKAKTQIAVEAVRHVNTGKIEVTRITVKRNSPLK